MQFCKIKNKYIKSKRPPSPPPPPPKKELNEISVK